MSPRYVCIHGHFYQPPRENPWTEAVEEQPSAHPYHDWNERITAECYAPNAGSYARMSFNFGPTLLSWLEDKAPQVYGAILQADGESRKSFGGHGSALAQPYNHMILPLASRRDRVTQVRWGIQDFRHRFGRAPEGMWLPETAVDLETLEILAECGIRFTLLAPHQVKRVRGPGASAWRVVSEAGVDPTMAYTMILPSGRTVALFFFNGAISRAVAFERLLETGDDLARRLMEGFTDSGAQPQLVHIASDGETYGHHHRAGEKALASALKAIESSGVARLTNYGEFLERHPPSVHVEIAEQSSWSCVHGADRWWSDCGCDSGAHPEWNQAWRTPLRNAMDWLRDEVAWRYEERARPLFREPWAARDAYIEVILDRSEESRRRFLGEHAVRPLDRPEQVTAWKLLELERHALLMYTSCGWFFDDLSGLEAVQILRYAGRAIQLAEELFRAPLEPGFLEILGKAKSNLPEEGDGRDIYERHVKPIRVGDTNLFVSP